MIESHRSTELQLMKSVKTSTITLLILITFVAGAVSAFGQGLMAKTAAKTNVPPQALYPLEDLRPGMKGIARTVFAGSEPQEFGVEILGVLPGYTGPRQSTIIARLSGANVDKTSVFAGMSGSPVFIDDKLVGAIAYSFPFAKEPICGITPIKQMIDIFALGNERPKSNEARAVSFASLASTWRPSLPKQAVGATSLIAPVSAGSALAPLMGQQIQPIAAPGRMVGSISQDRATGVFGQLGHAPKMIPVKLTLHTSRGQSEQFTYEIVSDEYLTPLLLSITVFNSIAARERSVGEATIRVNGSIAVSGQDPIGIQRRFSSANASML